MKNLKLARLVLAGSAVACAQTTEGSPNDVDSQISEQPEPGQGDGQSSPSDEPESSDPDTQNGDEVEGAVYKPGAIMSQEDVSSIEAMSPMGFVGAPISLCQMMLPLHEYMQGGIVGGAGHYVVERISIVELATDDPPTTKGRAYVYAREISDEEERIGPEEVTFYLEGGESTTRSAITGEVRRGVTAWLQSAEVGQEFLTVFDHNPDSFDGTQPFLRILRGSGSGPYGSHDLDYNPNATDFLETVREIQQATFSPECLQPPVERESIQYYECLDECMPIENELRSASGAKLASTEQAADYARRNGLPYPDAGDGGPTTIESDASASLGQTGNEPVGDDGGVGR